MGGAGWLHVHVVIWTVSCTSLSFPLRDDDGWPTSCLYCGRECVQVISLLFSSLLSLSLSLSLPPPPLFSLSSLHPIYLHLYVPIHTPSKFVPYRIAEINKHPHLNPPIHFRGGFPPFTALLSSVIKKVPSRISNRSTSPPRRIHVPVPVVHLFPVLCSAVGLRLSRCCCCLLWANTSGNPSPVRDRQNPSTWQLQRFNSNFNFTSPNHPT